MDETPLHADVFIGLSVKVDCNANSLSSSSGSLPARRAPSNEGYGGFAQFPVTLARFGRHPGPPRRSSELADGPAYGETLCSASFNITGRRIQISSTFSSPTRASASLWSKKNT
jgi:hypothetical protein